MPPKSAAIAGCCRWSVRPRRIGLFALPVLRVRFRFDRAEPQERERFFHRFHQYFHKGGG